MQVKELIKKLQQMPMDTDVLIRDENDNVYMSTFKVDVKTGAIILPLDILDHEWNEEVAEELYKNCRP